MKIRLLKYDLSVKYLPGKFMYIADLLSRYFDKNNFSEEISDLNDMVHSINVSNEKLQEFKKETKNDPILSSLLKVLMEGWPARKELVEAKLKSFWKFRSELFLEDNLIFFNERIIIPSSMRAEILKQLHTNHPGIEKTKSRARQIVYWPGINEDIENKIAKCGICQKYRNCNVKEPMLSHDIPKYPFQKIGMDIMQWGNKNYLVTYDYYSKFLDIFSLSNKTASQVITKLQSQFSTHGIPRFIVADNMPFNSYLFKQFCQSNDIELVTSSPHYPKSNGAAERAVQTAKNIIKKCKENNSTLWQALLEQRNTPIKGLDLSPAEMLFNRKTRTLLPTKENLFRSNYVPSLQKNKL